MDTEQEREVKQLQRHLRRLERSYQSLALMHEQSERMRTTNEIARDLSNFYNRLLLKNAPGIFFMLDLDLNFVLGNNLMVKNLGYLDMREMVGRPYRELFGSYFPADLIESLAHRCQRVIEQAADQDFDQTITLLTGEQHTYHIIIAPAADEGGECQGVILVFSDITELTRARADAEHASRVKSEFLSNMSHEMRTPLNAIIGMTAIGRAAENIERKQRSLVKIDEASHHLLEVINDILDMSKIETGNLKLTPAFFDLRELLTQAEQLNSILVEQKQQNFTLDIADDLPERLFGDAQRLLQALNNLLGNAVKFTEEGGSISLRVRRLADGEARADEGARVDGEARADGEARVRLEFLISDTGIGIDEQQQTLLFRSFAQADSSITRRFGGTGLGLVISKNIIEMMGGEIWVDSELGVGSTFGFTVVLESESVRTRTTSPTAHPDATKLTETEGALPGAMDFASSSFDASSSDASSSTHFIEHDYHGHTILLAEDTEVNAEIVLALLEPSGLTVDWVINGTEALARFTDDPRRYDLILMDVQMPKLDGLEATQIIRASGLPGAETIPIIAMTANVFAEDVRNYLASGMSEHLGKPINFDDFFACLDRYLL
ncbi:MAG: response regulator [Coriobacteriales bacterium]|nr:response regulator [Coriobacteriales bacterium]